MSGVTGGLHLAAKTVGVGMAVAGGSTAKRAFQLSPRLILQVATAGVYPGLGNFRPCDVVVASKIVLVDHAVAARQASFPRPCNRVKPHAMAPAGLANSVARHPPRDGRMHARMHGRRRPCGLRPKRGAPKSRALRLLPSRTRASSRRSRAAVLGITHVVGSNAAADWRTNERGAATRPQSRPVWSRAEAGPSASCGLKWARLAGRM